MTSFDFEISRIASKSKTYQFNQVPVKFGDSLFSEFDVLLPHVSDLRDFCYFLRLRAHLAIRDHDPEFAYTCTQLMWRLADTMDSNPRMIGNIYGIAIRRSAVLVIWDGMENHSWNAAQLESFHTHLIRSDSPLSMAKAIHIHTIISFSRGVSDILADKSQLDSPSEIPTVLGPYNLGYYRKQFPNGWWNQNRVLGVTKLFENGWWNQNRVLGVTKLFENAVIPARNRNFAALVNFPELGETDGPYPYIFYYAHLADLGNTIERNLETQTKINLATAACAVEQFRLKNKRLPDSITELKAANLGEIRDDFYNPAGGPLQYRKDSDNRRYLLYSYGTNQKDNGGTSESTARRSPFGRVDKETSDIVWRYSSPKILKLKALFDSGKWKPTP